MTTGPKTPKMDRDTDLAFTRVQAEIDKQGTKINDEQRRVLLLNLIDANAREVAKLPVPKAEDASEPAPASDGAPKAADEE